MITFDGVIRKLREGKRVELKFHLNFGVYSRHELTLERGKICDKSYVDGSTSQFTIRQYSESFYGEAFRKNAVELIEERTT